MFELYCMIGDFLIMVGAFLLLIWWSELPRQIWFWIDDKNDGFNPWLESYLDGKIFKFINIDDFFFDDPIPYFGLTGSLLLPLTLMLLILVWPVVFIICIIYAGALFSRFIRRMFKKINILSKKIGTEEKLND